uniref:Uncharacterized protein n=1 Tax=Rhizophora mucronata TaxID=61149 RepID=A0A2P2NJM6_RHIMU
MSLVTLVGK